MTASLDAAGLSPERLDALYTTMDRMVRDGRLPGAAVLVARHGVPAAARAFGRMRLDPAAPPIQPDTIFLVASVTKPVTVAGAMLLVERGKLLLNEPVAAYLPEFGNRGKEEVRVFHLMTHTSGLPDMLPDDRPLRRQHAPLAEFVRRTCELDLDFPPGANIQYQSMGIALLAAIVERLEGIPFPQFLQREIFTPLRMTNTSLGLAGLPVARIAEINVPDEMRGADWGWNHPYWRQLGAPWGGMFTTTHDMFRFCQMFLNRGELDGVRILSPATVAAMTRDQTSSLLTIPVDARYRQAWGLGWALHWRNQPAAGWSYFGDLVGAAAYGHGGATGTLVWVDPDRDMVCLLFTTQPTAIADGILGRCSNLAAAAAV